MSELPFQGLVELSKMLQEADFAPNEVALAHLRQANQIVDSHIAMLRSATRSESAQPDAMGTDLESTRDAIFKAYAALCDKQRDESSSSELTRLINETASLHDKINTLCWLIGENQADQDETLPGRFSSADDLFTAMGV
jgi:hypothetical protein